MKDLIDIAGEVTTAGCAAVADRAEPATRDAPCVAAARAAGAVIVGKTNLHELGLGATGINVWYGTPTNPLDPALMPGGSSSGSAVAVATGEADVALGSDTAGSCRIPAACCGVAGLKTTNGRVSRDGVWPLAPTLDAVGPIARDVAGIDLGMRLLEPGFDSDVAPARRVGRLRVDAASDIDSAVDRALASSGIEVIDVTLSGWGDAYQAGVVFLIAEAWDCDGHLLEREDGVDPPVAFKLRAGAGVPPGTRADAASFRRRWEAEVHQLLEQVDVLALPAIAIAPPPLDAPYAIEIELSRHMVQSNLAGVPSLALPVANDPLPASLQLIGPRGGEELLIATARELEARPTGPTELTT